MNEQTITCILTGLKLDVQNGVQRSAMTEASNWRVYIKADNFRPTPDGLWIEVNDGYNWSPVLPQTMQWWLKHENLPMDEPAKTEDKTTMTENALVISDPIDNAINGWLEFTWQRKSKSPRTAKTYRDTISSFRQALQMNGTDISGNPAQVRDIAEQWAAQSRKRQEVSPATFNQRIAIVSSFYKFVVSKGMGVIANPILDVTRAKAAEPNIMPYGRDDFRAALKKIDRTTLQGKRDYALLLILGMTGRREAEIAGMKRGDLIFKDGTILVQFPRCKGGKSKQDRLEKQTSKALAEWLQAYYGAALGSLPADAPIWISLSRRNRGKPMGTQTIGDVCQNWLGISKVHMLRHMFAVAMDEAGAPLVEIQQRLGHESLATTSRYMQRLHDAENPFADKLAKLYGAGD